MKSPKTIKLDPVGTVDYLLAGTDIQIRTIQVEDQTFALYLNHSIKDGTRPFEGELNPFSQKGTLVYLLDEQGPIRETVRATRVPEGSPEYEAVRKAAISDISASFEMSDIKEEISNQFGTNDYNHHPED